MSTSQTYGSDRIAAILHELGVTHVALNPGATLRGLHDSLVQRPGRTPRLVTCLHEEIAVAIAHGYAKAAGRPMAVAVHDTVGLLHASMAIFNAWADEVPILALAGTGPLDARLRRPWIDWVHTVTDQTELVRELTVWADQPGSLPSAVDAIRRAWAASMSIPRGPALVAIDVALQEARALGNEGGSLSPELMTIGRPGPDPDLVDGAAGLLRASQRPLLVTDRPLGQRAAAALVALAERAGAGMGDIAGGATVPYGHAHDVTDRLNDAIKAADLLLLVDLRDPGLVAPATTGVPPSTVRPVIEIGPSRLRRGSWMSSASQVASLRLDADAERGLEALLAGCAGSPRPLPAAFERLVSQRGRRASRSGRRGIGEGDLAHAVASATEAFRPVVATGALGGWTRRAFRFQHPDEYLGDSGGGGLGYAVPATLGVALAHAGSGRMALGIVGDGDLLYTPQALWTAAHEEIPALIVVNANRAYRQDWLHQRAVAASRSRSPRRAGQGVLLREPGVAIATLARAMGIHAEGPVAEHGQLQDALRRAVERVRGGAPALVEVVTRLQPGSGILAPGRTAIPGQATAARGGGSQS